MIEALQEGNSIANSDGSYKGAYGTAAWTIGSIDQPFVISGWVISPGGAKDPIGVSWQVSLLSWQSWKSFVHFTTLRKALLNLGAMVCLHSPKH